MHAFVRRVGACARRMDAETVSGTAGVRGRACECTSATVCASVSTSAGRRFEGGEIGGVSTSRDSWNWKF